MIPTRRLWALPTLALTLVLGACSTPEDLTAPMLEPQFGTQFNDIGFDVSVASNGRVYVLAEETGSDSESYCYSDGEYEYCEDYYYDYEHLNLQTYDTSGNVIATHRVATMECNWDYGRCNSQLIPRGLYADANGYRYALYSSQHHYDYQTTTHYVTKIDASGTTQTFSIGQGSTDSAKSVIDIAVDGSGNVYVAKTNYTHDYSTGTGSYTNGVAKYSTNGALLWQRTSTVGTPYGITVSSSGSVYVVGTTGVARYTNSGGLTWSKAANNSKGVLENAGNIVVSGSYIYTRSGKDIRKYSGTGQQLWLRTQSGLNTIVVQDIKGDGSGNLYVSGKYDADGSTKVNMNAYVRKLNGSGSVLWTKTYGTPAYDDARGIATITGSEIYTTGETQGSLAHPNRGGRDGYIRKMNSSGNPLWTR